MDLKNFQTVDLWQSHMASIFLLQNIVIHLYKQLQVIFLFFRTCTCMQWIRPNPLFVTSFLIALLKILRFLSQIESTTRCIQPVTYTPHVPHNMYKCGQHKQLYSHKTLRFVETFCNSIAQLMTAVSQCQKIGHTH